MTLSHLKSTEPFILSATSKLLLKELAHLRQTAQNRPVLIAISGESAAGKTTFINTLKRVLKSASFIDADNYFVDFSKKIQKAGSFANLVEEGFESDAPSSFQLQQMEQDLKTLKENKSVSIPLYDMKTGKSIPQAQHIQPATFIFVAGICTLYKPVSDLFDFKIYLQADEKLRFERYMKRAGERGQTASEAQRQYAYISKMAQKYILPQQQQADIIVKGRLPKHYLQQLFIQTIRSIA